MPRKRLSFFLARTINCLGAEDWCPVPRFDADAPRLFRISAWRILCKQVVNKLEGNCRRTFQEFQDCAAKLLRPSIQYKLYQLSSIQIQEFARLQNLEHLSPGC